MLLIKTFTKTTTIMVAEKEDEKLSILLKDYFLPRKQFSLKISIISTLS